MLKGPCSIAMLDYRSVSLYSQIFHHINWSFPSKLHKATVIGTKTSSVCRGPNCIFFGMIAMNDPSKVEWERIPTETIVILMVK